MDVEKTIEFLLQNQAIQDEKISRVSDQINSLARIVDIHSSQIGQLDEALKTLVDAQIQMREAQIQMREAQVQVREAQIKTDNQIRIMSERVDNLVSAIGKWLANGKH
ncbi:MAG: hypothetical protein ACRD8O_06990 [Bryobacteraceae bacterium]